jgi:vancomycin resistance protein YoaR
MKYLAIFLLLISSCSSEQKTKAPALTLQETPETYKRAPVVISNNVETVIGSYETKFNKNEANRVGNIKHAAERMNFLIQPGYPVSFNDVVGPRTEENGFKLAPTIFDGEIKPGVGGGVCQVSSTVFAAALNANLEIVHRQPHTRLSKYIKPGLDATVSFPAECNGDHRKNTDNGKNQQCYSIDLVVKNPLSIPVYLSTSATDSTIKASFYVVTTETVPTYTTEYKWYSRKFEDFSTEIRKTDRENEKETQKGQDGIYVYSTMTYANGSNAFTKHWKSRYPSVTRILEVGRNYTEPDVDAGTVK